MWNRPGYAFTNLKNVELARSSRNDSVAISRMLSRNAVSSSPTATSSGLATASHHTGLCATRNGAHAAASASLSPSPESPSNLPASAATLTSALAARMKMSFVSLACSTNALASGLSSAISPSSAQWPPTQRNISCDCIDVNAHSKPQYTSREHPVRHAWISGNGKASDPGSFRPSRVIPRAVASALALSSTFSSPPPPPPEVDSSSLRAI
eukprot:31252-Pelagococcus_subviridis.AAC.8